MNVNYHYSLSLSIIPFFCGSLVDSTSSPSLSSFFPLSFLLGGSFSSSSATFFLLLLLPLPFPFPFSSLALLISSSSFKSSSSFIFGGGAFGSRLKKELIPCCQPGVG